MYTALAISEFLVLGLLSCTLTQHLERLLSRGKCPKLKALLANFGNRWRTYAISVKQLYSSQDPEETRALLTRADGADRSAQLVLVFYYYSVFPVLLGVLVATELWDWLALLASTGFLRPAALRSAFEGERDLPAWFEQELQHILGNDRSSGFLWCLSILSMVFLVMTSWVTLRNMVRHMYAVGTKGGGIEDHPGHSSVVLIITLPLIYCLMSFRNMNRMWMVCANAPTDPWTDEVDLGGSRSWAARWVVRHTMYDTNLIAANGFKAVALYHFAQLVLAALGAARSARERADEPYRAESVVEVLGLQGINCCTSVCVFEFVIFLSVALLEVYVGAGALNLVDVLERHRQKVHYLFLGSGVIASYVASSNIETLHKTWAELLQGFSPDGKFWATRILVYFPYLPSILLYVPPFHTWSLTEGNILCASLLCIACAGMSFWYWIVWDPKEGWYDEVARYKRVVE